MLNQYLLINIYNILKMNKNFVQIILSCKKNYIEVNQAGF